MLTLEATYENGVFVPTERPALSEHERVRLVVERVEPQGRVAENTVDYRRSRRIKIGAELARQIAEDPEFDLENAP